MKKQSPESQDPKDRAFSTLELLRRGSKRTLSHTEHCPNKRTKEESSAHIFTTSSALLCKLQDTQSDKLAENMNIIKVFGTHKVQSVRHFFSIISKHGIPTSGIRQVTRAGYKSALFDSRHFKIRLKTSRDTSLVHRALTNAESHLSPMA